jgi:trimethylamine--corrinoid protein Co-methyltransferase
MSYEKFVVDLEMIDMINLYLKDIDVDEDSLSFDVIKAVGPGGQFLTTLDTFKKCRTHSWNPEISLRGTVHGNTPNGRLLENIHRRLKKLLADYQRPGMDAGIQKDLENYLMKSGVDREVIRRIHSL